MRITCVNSGELRERISQPASKPKTCLHCFRKVQRLGLRLAGSITPLERPTPLGEDIVHWRRSAQIAIGDADDYLFLKAKRWDLGNVPNWRAFSNNTIEADEYEYLSPAFWQGYKGNGEPYGIFNKELSQKVGRLGEEIVDECSIPNPLIIAA